MHDYHYQTAFAALQLMKQKEDQQDLADVATVWSCQKNKQKDICKIGITKMQPPRAFEYAYHFTFYKQMEKICSLIIFKPGKFDFNHASYRCQILPISISLGILRVIV